MELCCTFNSLNLSSPSRIGQTVRCLRSRFNLSGFNALSSGVLYTTGTPGATGDSAKITRSFVEVERDESVVTMVVSVGSGLRFDRERRHLVMVVMGGGGGLSSRPQ